MTSPTRQPCHLRSFSSSPDLGRDDFASLYTFHIFLDLSYSSLLIYHLPPFILQIIHFLSTITSGLRDALITRSVTFPTLPRRPRRQCQTLRDGPGPVLSSSIHFPFISFHFVLFLPYQLDDPRRQPPTHSGPTKIRLDGSSLWTVGLRGVV